MPKRMPKLKENQLFSVDFKHIPYYNIYINDLEFLVLIAVY